MDFVLRTPEASYPFDDDVKFCEFGGATKMVQEYGITLGGFLCKVLGISRSEFMRKLKEGAVYTMKGLPEWRRLKKDEVLETRITSIRLGRHMIHVWYTDHKHTPRDYKDLLLSKTCLKNL